MVRKIFATIFAILFVITAVVALFVFNFDRRAFTAETYQKAFAKEDFYNQLPAALAEAMISSGTDQSGFPIVMRGMSTEAWEAFYRALLPPETLKVMGDDLLNSTFAYLNLQTDSAQLNLVPLKISLTSDTGVEAVFALLATQPDCTLAQLGQMAFGLMSEQEMLLCNPPAEIAPLVAPVVQAQLQAATIAIPDQITIASASADGTNDPRQRLKIARLFMRLSPILPLTFLLALTIFAVRSLKSWLSWWGVSLFITGSIAFVMSLIGAPVFGAILERILVLRMPAYLPTILLDYASDFASVMVQTLLSPVLWQGLIIAFVGFLMAIASYFFKQKTT
ncbi:MAG: hypothetical protein H7Y59_01305 [Anaerolineales bacterium]|nr:hypothetical protein [Anaerolineales bacterium]